MMMGPIGCSKTSAKDYHSTLRNIPEERRLLASSVRTEQCDSHLLDLREMPYLRFLPKFVEAFRFWLKSDKNNALRMKVYLSS
jgi:hypothetical protein